jgi:hypothetical protein
MAILKNTVINDTGFLKLPVGTRGTRPNGAEVFNVPSNWGVSVGLNVSTTSGSNLAQPLAKAANGLQLYIGGGVWNRYQNLPNYLQGLLTTTSINDSNSCTFVFQRTGTVYLLRLPTWNAVDTTGWTTVETGRPYLTGGESVTVFSRTFTAGTYTFDNDSAMYFFDMQDAYTWVAPAGVTSIELLVVGAGGGGGHSFGGGGGGGGVHYVPSYSVIPGATYYIRVGDGGAGSDGNTRTGYNGGNSIFSNSLLWNNGIIGVGGGGGGRDGGDPDNGLPGGNGGGGSIDNNARAISIQTTISTDTIGTRSGTSGGLGGRTYYTGGGGGGAGQQGIDEAPAGVSPDNPFVASDSGRGGDGVPYNITGTTTYYGGGGGGGAGTQVHGRPGDGGLGGGGTGGSTLTDYILKEGSPGIDGLGGGGGGGAQGFNGGNGGCGCVIIRYNNNTTLPVAGMIRYNTNIQNVEYRSGYGTWEPVQALPFYFRTIITTSYMMGGYKDAIAWNNVNRTSNATDTTVNLGDGSLDRSFNYKGGACSLNTAFAFGAGNAHAVASNWTTAFSMRTETKMINQTRFNLFNTRGHAGALFQETNFAFITGGGSEQIEEFNLTTETNVLQYAGGFGTDASGSGGGPWGMSHENYGIWYTDGQATAFYFATRTPVGRAGTLPSAHQQQKSVQSKLTNCYAGNEGSYSGGNNLRRTNMFINLTAGTVAKPPGCTNSGEENLTLGQDHQYMLGMYNGLQNNISWKFTYATETGFQGGASMEPKGKGGSSSGVMAWRN